MLISWACVSFRYQSVQQVFIKNFSVWIKDKVVEINEINYLCFMQPIIYLNYNHFVCRLNYFNARVCACNKFY